MIIFSSPLIIIFVDKKVFKQKEVQYPMILPPNKTIFLGRKSDGRNNKEIGFALILNGIYQGFGYVDKKIKIEDTDDYQLYLQPQQDNRDVQRILKSYLTKKSIVKK